jgi:DHA1 family multidrug resistance protein-like MFS transporter
LRVRNLLQGETVGEGVLGQLLRRPVVLLLCGINLVLIMGYSLIMPIMPFYAKSMGASATQLGLLFASYSVTQFLFSPLWGRFSDRHGRRPAILVGLVGFAVTSVLFGLAQSLPLLFLARLVGGGVSCAAGPAAMAYMADVTNEEERGDGMSLMGATTGLGIILGPVMGGYLGGVSIQLPFLASAGLTLLLGVAALLMLPESAARGRQTSSNAVRQWWNPFGGRKQRNLLVRPLGFLLLLTLAINFASAVLESTFALFLEAWLGFGGREVGFAWAIAGVAMVVAQGFLVGPLMRKWGEGPLILLGLLSSALSYFILLLAKDLAGLLAIMGGMAVLSAGLRPAIATMLSRGVSIDNQGFIQGEQNRYLALGRIFGPFVGGYLFDAAGVPTPYIFGAFLYLAFLAASAVVLGRSGGRASAISADA